MQSDPPLAGVRVLDLSRLLPGPYASMVLADLGAHVDKVEDPRAGDYLRHYDGGPEMSAIFVALNRGKRSLVLDLKSEEGRDALLDIVESYDVVLESFRPGVMQRLGLDYEALRERHPALIYCAVSGYGQSGPLRERAGHDLNYLARSGVLGLSGPVHGAPQVPGVQMADIGGGALYAVIGVLAALEARHRTSKGRLVDVSMCEGALSLALFGLMGPPSARGNGVLSGGIAPYGTYQTGDGRFMALACVEPKFWRSFCVAVDRLTGAPPAHDGEDSPVRLFRYANVFAPGPHQAELRESLVELFASRTFAQWCSFAEQVDCCLEPVLTPDEVFQDHHHHHRGVFLQDPKGQLCPRTPVDNEVVWAPAPQHGEHSRQIMLEAGLGEARIARLLRK